MTRARNSYFVREIEIDDIAEVNRWRNDSSVIAMLGASYRYIGKGVERAWFDHYLANRSTTVRLAVCDTADQRIVGAAYLTGIDWTARSAEFAIWIGLAEHRGKGAGATASRALLRHAFLDLNLNRVHLTVLEGNAAARSLYQKLGFVEEGKLRSASYKNGCFVNLIAMAMLADEYER